MAKDKVVLAYSGGLDTSVAIRWLNETYNLDVVTLCVDVGSQKDLAAIKEKASAIGAVKSLTTDARHTFVRHFVWPALMASAIYEGQYPLATALARPLIAWLLVQTAREEGAVAVAHGCTGKGNDQVRFDVSINALAPDLKIIAPVREWRMTRDEEIEFARQHGIPVPATVDSPYSTDVNLWGRSVECGILEDPWEEPPEEVYEWTVPVSAAPAAPEYLEIEFERGVPVALNGAALDGPDLIQHLNDQGGRHGVGRIDHLENRLVGIKSREIYEAPAAVILHKAHQALEAMTMSKDAVRFKAIVAQYYADLVYNGLWFTAFHQDLAAYVHSSQRHVSGTVRVRLQRGTCEVVGRKSPNSLYNLQLATYDRADAFDHSAAVGFIKIWGLPVKTQADVQLLRQPAEETPILPQAASEH